MKKTYLLLASLLMAGGAMAQEGMPEGMVSLLPEGVKANISGTRRQTQEKNLVVAGEKTKGYKAFFAATDAEHGEELWVTDGTPGGTKMVKDIKPGTGGSDIRWMERFNDKVVFVADDGENGLEPWISDGTPEGTYMVANIHPWDGSEARGFVQLDENRFIFGAINEDSEVYNPSGKQWWLYVSDGMPDDDPTDQSGTVMIQECATLFPGQEFASFQSPWCRVGRKVFFKASDVDNLYGEEVWVTNGTTDGTFMLKDINTEPNATGTAGSGTDVWLNFYNEKLFFRGFTIEHGSEPWASDGTTEGTYEIIDSNPTLQENGFPNSGGASDLGPFPYNGRIYFRGWSQETGIELASTNLELGDFSIIDINTNVPSIDNNSFPDVGVEFDGVYMFCANSGTDPNYPETNVGGELRYTDGEQVYLQYDLAPGALHHWVKEPIVVSGSMYWWNEGMPDAAEGSEAVLDQKQKLYRIDSKTDVPVRVTNFSPSGDQVHTLRNLGGDLIFCTGAAGQEQQLYCYHYRKEGFDPAKDTDKLDIEFRTRAEIAGESGIQAIETGDVVLYPNPTTDEFSFNMAGDVTGVKVFDALGRLVKEEKHLNEGRTVNVSTLPAGLYSVLISSTEGQATGSLVVE